jgi:hypothetical protein
MRLLSRKQALPPRAAKGYANVGVDNRSLEMSTGWIYVDLPSPHAMSFG